MLRSLLIGAISGARSLSPIAVVSNAAARGQLAEDNGAPKLLANPLVNAGITTLAAGELWGDKWKSAPDRIIAPGIAARLVTAAVAGAALAPREDRAKAAALAAGAAVAASYVTFAARMWALRRWGQTPTGLVEDALVLGASAAVVHGMRPAA